MVRRAGGMPGLILAIAVLTAGGCVTVARWERAGATPAERQRDEAECMARADRERSVVGRRIVSSSRRDVNETLELVPRREVDLALYDECMRGRGYQRVEARR